MGPATSARRWICTSCRRLRQKPTDRSLSANIQTTGHEPRPLLCRNVFVRPQKRFKSDLKTGVRERGQSLPDLPARTRFAPSPTGYTHIGGLRTALFSYLLAKRTGGQFLLRIEDTDQKRLVPDAERRLCEDLQWAGLQWDEGPQLGGLHGPYKQSERFAIYQEHARALLDNGTAYRCFCTPHTLLSGQEKAAYVTSGCHQECASLPAGQSAERAETKEHPFTVRLRRPEDVHRRVYPDMIYGRIKRLKRSPSATQASEDDPGLDAADTILIKSDGTPTYHFANVVDDHLMEITHVIRGTEWMASTPLHFDLYSAFGWQPPKFAHVGLLVDENHAKLSKRNESGLILDVRKMREEQGILPETLINFLVLLGWSNPGRSDVLDLSTLIETFDLKFTKGNTVVNMAKLWYLQKQHGAKKVETARMENSLLPIAPVVERIRSEVEKSYPHGVSLPMGTDLTTYCAQILVADSKTYSTPTEYVNRNRYFMEFIPSLTPSLPAYYDEKLQISIHDLEALMTRMLTDFDWAQPYHDVQSARPCNASTNVAPDAKSPWDRTKAASARIHAAINRSIWHVLCFPGPPRTSPDTEETQLEAGKITIEDLPYTDQTVDVQAYAAYVHSKNPTLAGDAEELGRRYKAWNKAIMKYLRDRLSYGLPGPGVDVIMAILGWEECCRRLGIQATEGRKW